MMAFVVQAAPAGSIANVMPIMRTTSGGAGWQYPASGAASNVAAVFETE